MGNNTSSKGSGGAGDLAAQETAHVQAIFNEMCTQTAGPKVLSKTAFIKHFPENPEFAAKYYTWLEKLNGSSQIPFNTYAGALEVLTKQPMQYQLTQFNSRSFEKFEIFLQISTEQYFAEKDQASVSSAQGLQFFKELLNSFHTQKLPDARNIEVTAQLLLNTFFKENTTSVSWRDFIYDIKQHLPFVNKMVKVYFLGKFVERSMPLHLPVLADESYILNNELLGLFYLSNSFFQSVPKLQLIYSSAKSGTSFNRLAFAIKGYDGPTLILVRHAQAEDDHRGIPKGSYTFGGFTKVGWSDQLGYQGDSESYVFSLMPKYKAYYAYRGQGGTNYMYLNTRKIQGSKYKAGLGFGGEEYKNYRFWLDDELETGSYVGPDDNTYERGYLVHPTINKYNIDHVEIWGLGGDHALRAQQEFRQQEMDIIESQRKVDKKAFLQSGFDREMFLGNTFKTSERADQTDFRAEMEKAEQQKNENH